MNRSRALLSYARDPRIAKGRRDFLAWLAGGTALTAIGCSAAADASDPLARTPYGGDGATEEEALGESEEAWHTCRTTSRDARGPYWEPGSPFRATRIASLDEPGVRLLVEGRMLGPDCRTPLANYAVDVWQADTTGNYFAADESNYRLRGKIKTDTLGRYRFETILPGRYGDSAGIRPAHLHVSFLSPAANVILTTQLYFQGDPYLGQADYCTRNRTCNSSDPARALRLTDAVISGRMGKRATFDAVLSRT